MFVILVPVCLGLIPETARTFALALPMFLALLCLAAGLGWILATLNVFFRDVEHLMGVLFLPWFFLTPVLYSLDQLPKASQHAWLIKLLRYANPATPYVEGIRGAIVQAAVPGPALLVYIFVVGPAIALLGLWIVQRYEDRFALEL
jgi:ABC-type polysaccharide/polyol phosphate export permease